MLGPLRNSSENYKSTVCDALPDITDDLTGGILMAILYNIQRPII